MKFFISSIFFFSAIYSYSSEPKVTELRSLFYESETNKESWIKLCKLVEPLDTKSDPLLLCYRGASEMMGAKYVLNPMAKLTRFKKGRSMIEEAVKRAPSNLEIRFLRFSIQTNLPGFLGYDKHINEDKKILLVNVENSGDMQLKNNIITYLSSTKHCTDEEKKELKR